MSVLEMFGHEKKKVHQIIDFAGIAFPTYFGAIRNDEKLTDEESQFNYWRYLMLSTIADIKNRYKSDNIFICAEGGSWRSDEFEYYKAKRKEKRLENPEELEGLFKHMDLFLEELRDVFKFNILSVKKCEGDDGIAFCVHELPKEDIKVVCSADKDMVQLLDVENTIFYNTRNRCETLCDNPQVALQKLIMMGDTSDGIPNMKSDGDTFIIKGKRQKACGEKAVAKILIEGLDKVLLENAMWRKNYRRNEKLITLDEKNIPVKIWQAMKEQFEAFEYKSANAIKIGGYLTERNLLGLMDRINSFV